MMTRRRWLACCALIAQSAPLVLGGCAAFGPPTSHTVSEAELARLLARDFPQQRRVLEVIELDIGVPTVALLPASNRVATSAMVNARERLFGGRWRVQVGFEAGLRWQPEDASVRLVDVRVTQLVPADGSTLPSQSQAAATALAQLVLNDRPLYRVPAERLARLREHGVEPSSLDVTPQGLVIGLKPVR